MAWLTKRDNAGDTAHCGSDPEANSKKKDVLVSSVGVTAVLKIHSGISPTPQVAVLSSLV